MDARVLTAVGNEALHHVSDNTNVTLDYVTKLHTRGQHYINNKVKFKKKRTGSRWKGCFNTLEIIIHSLVPFAFFPYVFAPKQMLATIHLVADLVTGLKLFLKEKEWEINFLRFTSWTRACYALKHSYHV